MAAQLARLPAPALVVLDGQTELTTLTQQLWPRAPIRRCWWHVPPGLRKAFYADEALAAWMPSPRPSPTSSPARTYLATARDHAFTCLDPTLRARLARLGGPELGTGVLQRVMRELNARTDIGARPLEHRRPARPPYRAHRTAAAPPSL
jgi:hypothetical protein